MPRPATAPIDELVRTALDEVVRRASADIARAIAELAAERLGEELAVGALPARRGRPRGAARAGRATARTEITRWSADRRARRVPTFVIDLTGLDTKKAIVAKYGDGATFEKGKPAPKAKG